MKILIINGPNLNLTGVRETQIYGTETFNDYLDSLKSEYQDSEINYFQSSLEGELIQALHDASTTHEGIVINPGGFTHTSIALADAIAAIDVPVIEVHLSNLFNRDRFRQHSLTARAVKGIIMGFGLAGYQLAIESLVAGRRGDG